MKINPDVPGWGVITPPKNIYVVGIVRVIVMGLAPLIALLLAKLIMG